MEKTIADIQERIKRVEYIRSITDLDNYKFDLSCEIKGLKYALEVAKSNIHNEYTAIWHVIQYICKEQHNNPKKIFHKDDVLKMIEDYDKK